MHGHRTPAPLHVCDGLASSANAVRCIYSHDICAVTRYVAALH